MIVSKEIVVCIRGTYYSAYDWDMRIKRFLFSLKEYGKDNLNKDKNSVRPLTIQTQFVKSVLNGEYDMEATIQDSDTTLYKNIVDFMTLGYALKVSYIGKDNTMGVHYIPIKSSDLFNWYRGRDFVREKVNDERRKTRYKRERDSKRTGVRYNKIETLKDDFTIGELSNQEQVLVNEFLKNTSKNDPAVSGFSSWDGAPLIKSYIQIPTLYQHITPKYKSKYPTIYPEIYIVDLITNKSTKIEYGGIIIPCLYAINGVRSYGGESLTESRLNEIMDAEIKINPVFSENISASVKPRTAFIDIETNVGEIESDNLGINDYKTFDPVAKKMQSEIAENYGDDTNTDLRMMLDNNENVKVIKVSSQDRKYNIDRDDDDDDDDDFSSRGFSKPNAPYQPINTIAISNHPNVVILARGKSVSDEDRSRIEKKINDHITDVKMFKGKEKYKFTYLTFETEYELIEYFLYQIVRKFDAVSGWNMFAYDWAYIINRYAYLLDYYYRTITYTPEGEKVYKTKLNYEYYNSVKYRPCSMVDEIIMDRILHNVPTKTREEFVSIAMKLCTDSGSYTIIRKQIGFKSKDKKDYMSVYIPKEKIVYDYMEIYDKWYLGMKESLSLDHVSEVSLHVPKLPRLYSFDVFYKNHYTEYLSYNALDAVLLELIDWTIKSSKIYFGLCRIAIVEPQYMTSPVRSISILTGHYLFDEGKVLPKHLYATSDEGFAGAYVFEPLPGFYRYVCAFDFASLYPSTMRQFNISPDTLVCVDKSFNVKVDKSIAQFYEPEYVRGLVDSSVHQLKDNEVVCMNGAIYRTDVEGIIPKILTKYYNYRVSEKAVAKQATHNYYEIKREIEKRESVTT